MALSNFERLIAMADEAFDYRTDPDQIEVTDEQREKLLALHPSTMTAYNTPQGPAAWLMVIPTTTEVMEQFIKGEITEKQLLQLTSPEDKFEAIYLCSALVLEEYRRKGITEKLTLDAIAAMRREHGIKALYVWPFSDGGDKLAEKVAREVGLPLYKRVG